MKDSAAKLSHQKVTEELQRKITSIHPYLEVETTTLGGLDEEGTSLVGPATCFGFEELVLLPGPLVGFLGRRRGILNLVCFFSYSSAKSAIVCVRSTFVSQTKNKQRPFIRENRMFRERQCRLFPVSFLQATTRED